MGEWINKNYTMGYCTALREKEIQIHGTAQMTLEDTMLGERSWSQKNKWDPMIPLQGGT